MDIRKIIKTAESANINFLLGSGLSRPFLSVLNNIESDITVAKGDEAKILGLKKQYFTEVMLGNLKIIDDVTDDNKKITLLNYINFYKALNEILIRRENSILTKQVNIFTTNIDVFSEKALEEIGIDFNDGFSGRFKPTYNLGNFKKSYFKKSLHYENTSEIPVFNILKIHGSVTWQKEGGKVILDKDLTQIRELSQAEDATKGAQKDFKKLYDKLMIVNPTKGKLEETLNEYYYDLLRIYSNELEKENTVLFVMGFSFADEHIRNLTERVAGANPTLKIYIFEYRHRDDRIESLKQDILSKDDEGRGRALRMHNSQYIGTLVDAEEYVSSLMEEISSENWTTFINNLNISPIEKLSQDAKNKNILIVSPARGQYYTFDTINSQIFEQVVPSLEKRQEEMPQYSNGAENGN